MIWFRFLISLLLCCSAFAQSTPTLIRSVGTASDLAGLNPSGLVLITLTNDGGGAFRYDATSLAATNTNSVFRPNSIGSGSPGRWIGISTVAGKTLSDLQSGSGGGGADKVATNGGFAWALTIADASPSKLAGFDSLGHLTNLQATATEANYLVGATNTIQTQINSKLLRFGTIADLVASSIPANGTSARVEGYYSSGDGGGGLFSWNSSSVAFTNLGIIFKLTSSSTGRWIRVNEGPISPLQFGAKMDDSTDDSLNVQRWVRDSTGWDLYIPAGRFSRVNGITLLDPKRITGGGSCGFRPSTTLANSTGFFDIQTSDYVSLRGFTIDGNNQALTLLRVRSGGIAHLEDLIIQNAFHPAGNSVSAAGLRIDGDTRIFGQNLFISNIVATPNGIAGDNIGVARGIIVQQITGERTPRWVLLNNITVDGVYPFEDSDAVAIQGWTSNCNVHITDLHVLNTGKRALKALSPGGSLKGLTISNPYDGTGATTNVMYSAVSIYAGNWDVSGVQANEGGWTKIIDIGTDSWVVTNVTVRGFNLASAPSSVFTNTEGIWIGSGVGCSNITIGPGSIKGVQLGVAFHGGVTNATVQGVQSLGATEAAFHVGQRYSLDSGYSDCDQITFIGNIFQSSYYGIRVKQGSHIRVNNSNSGTAIYPVIYDSTATLSADTYPVVFNSAASMVANADPWGFHRSFQILGYANPGDGGGGIFYSTNAALATNISTVFQSLKESTWRFVRADIFVAGTGIDVSYPSGFKTVSLADSGVTAGTYGNGSYIPQIVVDQKGRITSISTNAAAGGNLLVHQQTSTSSLTPDFGNYGAEELTALATGLTINAPSGSPSNLDRRYIVITSASIQTLTWNGGAFEGTDDMGILPTATSGSSKLDQFLFVYSSTKSKWIWTGRNMGAN